MTETETTREKTLETALQGIGRLARDREIKPSFALNAIWDAAQGALETPPDASHAALVDALRCAKFQLVTLGGDGRWADGSDAVQNGVLNIIDAALRAAEKERGA